MSWKEWAKQMFLEQEANQIFARIGNLLDEMDKVLRAAGASVEIDAKWELLGDQKLRRVAKVISASPPDQHNRCFNHCKG
jgi:hypothetical protein